jgi:tRNA(Ile)-lysidine synthase
MQELFNQHIHRKKLTAKNETVLLAVSGGIDSIVMAHLFHNSGYIFGIAHCNFGLRGEESDGDAAFVKKITEEIFHVPFFYKKFNLKKSVKVNTQLEARRLRYEWFEEIRSKNHYNYIATAHHRDDQSETFFINLLRGSGITGLSGIPEKQGRLIRPLLFATRNDIALYAKKNNIHYREDSSNNSDAYLRNKIRHHLIPLLESLNPDFKNVMQRNQDLLFKTDTLYKYFINQTGLLQASDANGFEISIPELMRFPEPGILLFELISVFNFHSKDCEKIIRDIYGISGATYFSKSHVLLRDRDKIIINALVKKTTESLVTIHENQTELNIPVVMSFEKFSKTEPFKIDKSANVACFDYEKLAFPLVLRKWKRGDSFYPLGMRGRKKISDLFCDLKMNQFEKADCWLLCSAEEIIWVMGKRMDDRFKVTSRTKMIYKIDFKNS